MRIGHKAVLAVSIVLMLVLVPSITAIPVAGIPKGEIDFTVEYVEFIVRGEDIPQLIGARPSSLKAAVFTGKSWVNGEVYVLPNVTRTFIASSNSSSEALFVDERIGRNTLLYFRIPLVQGRTTNRWGLEFIKCRLHNRVYIEAQVPGRGTVRFYVYYDRETLTSNIPFNPYWTARTIKGLEDRLLARRPSITVLGTESRKYFMIDRRTGREVGYDGKLFPDVNPAEIPWPPINIDGGGGGGGGPTEVGALVYAVDLTIEDPSTGLTPIRSANPDTWTTTRRYIGYDIDYMELVTRACTLSGQEWDILQVQVKIIYNDTGETAYTKSASFNISNSFDYYRLTIPSLYDSETHPISVEVSYKTSIGEAAVYPMIYFKKEVYDEEPKELKWFNVSFANYYFKPQGIWFDSDIITFHGVAATPGTFLNSTGTATPVGLRIDLAHYDSRSDAPYTKTIKVYFNGVQVYSADVEGVPQGYGRMYVLNVVIPIDEETAYLIASSLKYNSSMCVSIKVPEVNETFSTLEIWDLRLIGKFMPEAWRPGSESYKELGHMLGEAQQVVYSETCSNSMCLGVFVMSAHGFDYYKTESGYPIGSRHLAFEIVASAANLGEGSSSSIFMATMHITVPIPSGTGYDDIGHNEVLEGQANEWLTTLVEWVKEAYQLVNIGLRIANALGYNINIPYLWVIGNAANLLKKAMLSDVDFTWSVEGNKLILDYVFDAGLQPPRYGRFRAFLQYSCGSLSSGTTIVIDVSGYVNLSDGAATVEFPALIYVRSPEDFFEPYVVYGFYG